MCGVGITFIKIAFLHILFLQHSVKFPDTVLERTVEAYPMLNKAKTELSLISENSEFKTCSWFREMFLYSEEDQDLPEKRHDTGSPECSGYALHGEETC